MLSSALLGGSTCVTGAALWRWRTDFVAGAVFLCIWVCVCVAGAAFGRCLRGLDVVERAARGLNLRDRRSTLEMACKFRGRRSSFCIWVCVCVAGAAFGSCLKGLDVVERAARGLNLRDRRSTLEMARRFHGRRSIVCIWVCVCVAGATCGSCLGRLDVVERAARGLNLRDRRSTLETGHRFRGRRSVFWIWVCVCVAGATCGSCLERLDVVEHAARLIALLERPSKLCSAAMLLPRAAPPARLWWPGLLPWPEERLPAPGRQCAAVQLQGQLCGDSVVQGLDGGCVCRLRVGRQSEGKLPCSNVRAVSYLSVVQDLRGVARDRSFKHVFLGVTKVWS